MIMNRIFLLAAALFMAFSCHSVDPEIKVEVEPEEEVGVEIKVDTYVFQPCCTQSLTRSN